MCIFSGWETCVSHYNTIRGNALLGPPVQSGFLFIFLKGKEIYLFFPCVFCAHFLFNTDTKFTFLAPKALSAPHSKVCKVNFVFLDHIFILRPSPGSVLLLLSWHRRDGHSLAVCGKGMEFWHTVSSHCYHADGSSLPGYKLELSGTKDRRDLNLCHRKLDRKERPGKLGKWP